MSKIICLTAGHSNTDPGAVNGSDREADVGAGYAQHRGIYFAAMTTA